MISIKWGKIVLDAKINVENFISVFVTIERIGGHTQNFQTMDYYLVAKEGHEPEIKARKNISNEAQKVIRSNKNIKKKKKSTNQKKASKNGEQKKSIINKNHERRIFSNIVNLRFNNMCRKYIPLKQTTSNKKYRK